MLVEVLQVALEQVNDVVASALSLIAELEDGADLCEAETTGLSVADEEEPFNRIRLVDAVAVVRPFGRGYEPDGFVIANRLGGNPGLAGEFSDVHTVIIPLDIPFEWKVYVGEVRAA